jgi:GTP-dependent phosphoenolpyruvate carboxykinase
MRELFSIKPEEWQREVEGQAKFFDSLGGVVPDELLQQREHLAQRLAKDTQD